MKSSDHRRRWAIAGCAAIALIFAHSCMPATVSGEESGRLLLLLQRLAPFLTDHLLRKLAHFSEFFLLGLLLAQWYRPRLLPATLLGLSTALCDETIQLFVEGRSGQVTDIWIDFSGILTALTLTLALTHLPRRQQKR